MSFLTRPPLPTNAALAGVVNPFTANMHAGGVFPGNAVCTFQMNTDGTISYGANDAVGGPNWYTPTTGGIGSGFWVRLSSLVGDPLTTGTINAWLQLNTNRLWQLSQGAVGTKQSDLVYQVATDALGTNIVASGNLQFVAEVLP